jgi:alkylated DNA repair dioxygenase AlkB
MNELFSSGTEGFITQPYKVEAFDLPDADIILYNGFFNKIQSDRYYHALLSGIDWNQDQIKYYGKLHKLPRLTAWYGETGKPYTYSGIQMNPKHWTTELMEIKQKIESVAHVQFTSVLLNRYRIGSDSVSWHSDDEKELGTNPVIGSVTFGESRKFQLRHKTLKKVQQDIVLTHGSFLLMRGTTQHHWQHQIPKTTKKIRDRINLTFRVIQ